MPTHLNGNAYLRMERKMATKMAAKTLDNLFLDTLKDVYYAEKKILRTLPKMAKAANAKELAAAFEKHRDQTEGQVDRLERIFEMLGKRPQGKTCPAIDGIIEEGQEALTTTSHRRRSMRGCLPRRKRWSITRSPATAR